MFNHDAGSIIITDNDGNAVQVDGVSLAAMGRNDADAISRFLRISGCSAITQLFEPTTQLIVALSVESAQRVGWAALGHVEGVPVVNLHDMTSYLSGEKKLPAGLRYAIKLRYEAIEKINRAEHKVTRFWARVSKASDIVVGF